MAYIPDNLSLVYQPIGGTLPRTYTYLNTDDDSNATLVGAGFFSDGVTKGLRVSDMVIAVNPTTAKKKEYQVASVSGAAATVAAVTAIT